MIILSRKDIVPATAPQIHPDFVTLLQTHHAAAAGHLAALVWQRGVVQRHQRLSVLDDGGLSSPVHRHVHGEVVQTGAGAGEDPRAGIVAVSLVGHDVAKLEDSAVRGVAVIDPQLGRESNGAGGL